MVGATRDSPPLVARARLPDGRGHGGGEHRSEHTTQTGAARRTVVRKAAPSTGASAPDGA